ncbi:hypothetical protein AYO20_04736 [Fonsecaea nubica]|uniref:Transmembrane protein n=1 Tax=Fonsecaea nubica TaxID=856822 RepID=A0A178D3X4_9EURO|nr:hypothetical protein AYO20_04736 [Fonsecaea nubica]OAL36074.1 hypothetical protein AYO20_04736 [Fonsecaea nubica]
MLSFKWTLLLSLWFVANVAAIPRITTQEIELFVGAAGAVTMASVLGWHLLRNKRAAEAGASVGPSVVKTVVSKGSRDVILRPTQPSTVPVTRFFSVQAWTNGTIIYMEEIVDLRVGDLTNRNPSPSVIVTEDICLPHERIDQDTCEAGNISMGIDVEELPSPSDHKPSVCRSLASSMANMITHAHSTMEPIIEFGRQTFFAVRNFLNKALVPFLRLIPTHPALAAFILLGIPLLIKLGPIAATIFLILLRRYGPAAGKRGLWLCRAAAATTATVLTWLCRFAAAAATTAFMSLCRYAPVVLLYLRDNLARFIRWNVEGDEGSDITVEEAPEALPVDKVVLPPDSSTDAPLDPTPATQVTPSLPETSENDGVGTLVNSTEAEKPDEQASPVDTPAHGKEDGLLSQPPFASKDLLPPDSAGEPSQSDSLPVVSNPIRPRDMVEHLADRPFTRRDPRARLSILTGARNPHERQRQQLAERASTQAEFYAKADSPYAMGGPDRRSSPPQPARMVTEKPESDNAVVSEKVPSPQTESSVVSAPGDIPVVEELGEKESPNIQLGSNTTNEHEAESHDGAGSQSQLGFDDVNGHEDLSVASPLKDIPILDEPQEDKSSNSPLRPITSNENDLVGPESVSTELRDGRTSTEAPPLLEPNLDSIPLPQEEQDSAATFPSTFTEEESITRSYGPAFSSASAPITSNPAENEEKAEDDDSQNRVGKEKDIPPRPMVEDAEDEDDNRPTSPPSTGILERVADAEEPVEGEAKRDSGSNEGPLSSSVSGTDAPEERHQQSNEASAQRPDDASGVSGDSIDTGTADFGGLFDSDSPVTSPSTQRDVHQSHGTGVRRPGGLRTQPQEAGGTPSGSERVRGVTFATESDGSVVSQTCHFRSEEAPAALRDSMVVDAEGAAATGIEVSNEQPTPVVSAFAGDQGQPPGGSGFDPAFLRSLQSFSLMSEEDQARVLAESARGSVDPPAVTGQMDPDLMDLTEDAPDPEPEPEPMQFEPQQKSVDDILSTAMRDLSLEQNAADMDYEHDGAAHQVPVGPAAPQGQSWPVHQVLAELAASQGQFWPVQPTVQQEEVAAGVSGYEPARPVGLYVEDVEEDNPGAPDPYSWRESQMRSVLTDEEFMVARHIAAVLEHNRSGTPEVPQTGSNQPVIQTTFEPRLNEGHVAQSAIPGLNIHQVADLEEERRQHVDGVKRNQEDDPVLPGNETAGIPESHRATQYTGTDRKRLSMRSPFSQCNPSQLTTLLGSASEQAIRRHLPLPEVNPTAPINPSPQGLQDGDVQPRGTQPQDPADEKDQKSPDIFSSGEGEADVQGSSSITGQGTPAQEERGIHNQGETDSQNPPIEDALAERTVADHESGEIAPGNANPVEDDFAATLAAYERQLAADAIHSGQQPENNAQGSADPVEDDIEALLLEHERQVAAEASHTGQEPENNVQGNSTSIEDDFELLLREYEGQASDESESGQETEDHDQDDANSVEGDHRSMLFAYARQVAAEENRSEEELGDDTQGSGDPLDVDYEAALQAYERQAAIAQANRTGQGQDGVSPPDIDAERASDEEDGQDEEGRQNHWDNGDDEDNDGNGAESAYSGSEGSQQGDVINSEDWNQGQEDRDEDEEESGDEDFWDVMPGEEDGSPCRNRMFRELNRLQNRVPQPSTIPEPRPSQRPGMVVEQLGYYQSRIWLEHDRTMPGYCR